jgi:hypothetical protein
VLSGARVVHLGPRLFAEYRKRVEDPLEKMNEGIEALTSPETIDFLRQIERHPATSTQLRDTVSRLVDSGWLGRLRRNRTGVSASFKLIHQLLHKEQL